MRAIAAIAVMACSARSPTAPQSSNDTGSGSAVVAGSGSAAVGPGSYQPDYKTSKAFFTRMSHAADSGSVHGSVRIWYSANVATLAAAGPFVAPEGTVAVKEEYDASNRMFVKVVMIKKPAGYDPSHHDWYYEARHPDDSLANDPVPGKAKLCIECHLHAEATDYLQGFGLAN